MHKKWNSYLYLESDTTSENFEAGIMKFIVTRHPVQFTHSTEIRLLWHCFWKSIVTFAPNNSVLCDTLQNTALYKVLHSFTAVHRSAILHTFPILALASVSTHVTWALRFSLQFSLFWWNPIYWMVSPCKSASWTASLTLHLNFHTGTSEQSFGDFFVENFQWLFFLNCFVMQDVCIDHYQVEQMKEKFLPPFYWLPFKRIMWQHLVDLSTPVLYLL